MRVEVWWDQKCTAVCQHVWGPWILIAAGVAPECFGILEGKTAGVLYITPNHEDLEVSERMTVVSH